MKAIENFDVTILTKINSLSEKEAKEKFLIDNNININIKTVNIDNKKTDVVDAKNNILIDDEIKNLRDWKEHGGIGILYSKNMDDKDSDGIPNEDFRIVYKLSYELVSNLLSV